LTVLIYLNEDFSGGHTKFYEPMSKRDDDVNAYDSDGTVIASVKPRTGSMLVFPQAISESAVERVRHRWPLHEGSPVTSGERPTYVVRTDVLFETVIDDGVNDLPEEEKVLFQNDDAVRTAFLNPSPILSTLFLNHIKSLYNPHMGVENAGPMLHLLVRFAKCRNVVEVGAGYTALKDNDEEMKRLVDLEDAGLSIRYSEAERVGFVARNLSSSLLCIGNCEH